MRSVNPRSGIETESSPKSRSAFWKAMSVRNRLLFAARVRSRRQQQLHHNKYNYFWYTTTTHNRIQQHCTMSDLSTSERIQGALVGAFVGEALAVGVSFRFCALVSTRNL